MECWSDERSANRDPLTPISSLCLINTYAYYRTMLADKEL